MINVALAKGRRAEKCADIFIKCGIRAEILKEETRKLVLETADKKFKFFFVKRANEHKVGKLANNLNRVGNATLPHLLPNGVDLTLSCSSYHGYLPFFTGSLSAQAH